MLLSVSLLLLTGLLLAALSERLGLPRLIGMLAAGMLLGPCCLGWLDASLLGISADLRRMALVLILVKAGLALDPADLRRVGRPALLLSFLPACFELAACALLAPLLFGISVAEGALMGAVLAAVSPAVVVPRMVDLIERRLGTEQAIPQMLLAGASLDDVFVIVLFSTFLGMVQTGTASAGALLQIPLSIVLGIALGVAAGWATAAYLRLREHRGKPLTAVQRTLILLGVAFALSAAEALLAPWVPLSGLLAVTAAACTVHLCAPAPRPAELSAHFGKLWSGAELFLFGLVGAAVDIRYLAAAGPLAAVLIVLALCVRSAGVGLSVAGTRLNGRERLFCVLSYLPKATVQAAIGGIPLAMGLPCGRLILSVAVLAIVLTAPIGAFAIDRSAKKLLRPDGRRPEGG